MKLPRVSVRSIMIALGVVAVDCAIYRSFSTRSKIVESDHWILAIATLPMANILALVIGRCVRDGARVRPFGLGFAIGGLAGLAATALWYEVAVYALFSAIGQGPFARWIATTPLLEYLVEYGIQFVMPFLVQLWLAVACGFLVRFLARRLGASTLSLPDPSSRRAFRSLLVMGTLLALPALSIEGYLRWVVEPSIGRVPEEMREIVARDPKLARRPAGLRAVLALRDERGRPVNAFAPEVLKLDGAEVRVEKDDGREYLEFVPNPANPMGYDMRDLRPVQVTLLDGQRAGESINMPHYLLRPLP